MTGRGRPKIGARYEMRITPDLLAKIDRAAKAVDMTRAEWIRQALEREVAR